MTLSLRQAAEALYRLALGTDAAPPTTRARRRALFSDEPPLADPLDAWLDTFGHRRRAPIEALDALERDLARAAQTRAEPLLVVATAIFEFLHLRPFPDGNGRVARLLSIYLLRRSGFSFVDYVALDPGHASDTGSYQALEGSGVLYQRRPADLRPWWGFVLRMLALAARELHDRLSPGVAETRSAHVRDVISASRQSSPSRTWRKRHRTSAGRRSLACSGGCAGRARSRRCGAGGMPHGGMGSPLERDREPALLAFDQPITLYAAP